MEGGAPDSGAGRVHVFARVRPCRQGEEGLSSVEPDEASRNVKVRNDGDAVERVLAGQTTDLAVGNADVREFSFDGVFPTDAGQKDIFNQVGLPVLREGLKGYNGTILAYGQTGSGKTFSLQNQSQRSEEVGLLPRLVANLFVHIAQDHAHVYHIEAAAMQVYNEQVDDLLHAEYGAGIGQGLNVQGGGVIQGLTWVECKKPDTMLEAFTKARSNLVYAETRMNKASSRSHAVFQIKIVKRQRMAGEVEAQGSGQKMECTHSRLSIVDLAGSERVKKSGAEGVQFREATSINKSLLAFGNVVSALANKRGHVPFRDSKLTRILEGSIGGNCKTSLLVCVSPSSDHVSETINTFEFASRAMRVEVNAKVNVSLMDIDAKSLLADMQVNSEEFGFSLSSEILAAKKESAEALKRAEEEAQRRELEAAAAEKTRLNLAEELTSLRRSRDTAESQIASLKEAVASAERTAADKRKVVEDFSSKLQKVEGAKTTLEAEVKKLLSEKETAQQGLEVERKKLQQEKEAERKKLQQEKEVERRKFQQEREVECQKLRKDLEVARKGLEVEKSKKKDEMDGRCKGLIDELDKAQQALENESSLRSAKEDALEKELVAKEDALQRLEVTTRKKEQLEQRLAERSERAQAQETALREALENESSLRSAKEDALEKELEAKEDALQRLETTTRKKEQLEQRLAEQSERAEAQETALRQALENESSLRSAKEDALEKELEAKASLQETLTSTQTELARQEASLEQARQELCRVQQEAASALSSLREEADQREAALHKEYQSRFDEAAAEHAQALQRLEEELETRLKAGREEMEEKLQLAEEQFQTERARLQHSLAEQREDRDRAEALWRDDREEVLRQSAAREQELREAYDQLANRFSRRESRPEDTRRIHEQERNLHDHRRSLHMRESQLEYLHRELQNRDDTDRIFGSASSSQRSSRGPTPRGYGPPLPGKKVGEAQPFVERRRRAVSASRARSHSMSMTSFHGSTTVFDVPVLAS